MRPLPQHALAEAGALVRVRSFPMVDGECGDSEMIECESRDLVIIVINQCSTKGPSCLSRRLSISDLYSILSAFCDPS